MAELVSINELILDPVNARKHSKKNLEAIKGSLIRFGQQKPIVVSEDNIVIAGNGTLEAARALGWDKIEIRRSFLKGSDITAYAIADNRTGELAEWDLDILPGTLEALSKEFDLSEIGFDKDDLAKFIKEDIKPGLTDDDAIPEQVDMRCKLGDLWMLGEHRLLCGDSTDVFQVERLMGGEKADMVFTDPPYGINVKMNNPGTVCKETIVGDATTIAAVDAYNLCLSYKIPLLFWGANHYLFDAKLSNSSCWIVWDKQGGKHVDHADCELAWSNLKGPARIFQHIWDGFRRDSEKGERRIHPTQKPVKLFEEIFSFFKKQIGNNVLDLFLGSGSTLIACEKTHRKCYGMEIDPHYCDVILTRWEKFTGKTATLLSVEPTT